MSRPWVLVTGGAQRLGREFCLAFARAGWDVACHYRQSRDTALQTCEELRQLGVQARAVGGALDNAAAVAALYAAAVEAMGGVPGAVVNNASVFDPDHGIDFSPELLARQLQVNLSAPLQLGSLLARQLREAPPATGTPCVLHVLDQKVFNLNPDYFSYTVSKLALQRAVAAQAQALAPGVRVNAVAPGLVYRSGPQSADNFALASRINLLGSPIDPADVASAGLLLAQNASITGVTLCVDKGQHLVPLERDVMYLAQDWLSPGEPL